MAKQLTWKQMKRLVELVDEGIVTRENFQKFLENPEGMASVVAQASIEYFTPLADTEVPESHAATLAKYRRLATEWGVPVTTPVCYKVRAGFTLKSHAALLGPCVKDFQYLRDWDFSDEPTTDCLVFWVPRLVPNSTSKTRDEQLALLGEIRTRLELPAHHLVNLGSVAQGVGLILAHYKATKERVPLGDLWARTETCRVGGYRLSLRWGDGRLYCDYWVWGDGRRGHVGVFALGVEEVLGN